MQIDERIEQQGEGSAGLDVDRVPVVDSENATTRSRSGHRDCLIRGTGENKPCRHVLCDSGDLHLRMRGLDSDEVLAGRHDAQGRDHGRRIDPGHEHDGFRVVAARLDHRPGRGVDSTVGFAVGEGDLGVKESQSLGLQSGEHTHPVGTGAM